MAYVDFQMLLDEELALYGEPLEFCSHGGDYMRYNFDNSYGAGLTGADQRRGFLAFTASRVFFLVEYDDTLTCMSVPRSPAAILPGDTDQR